MIPVDIIILSWDRTGDTIAAIRSAAGQQGVVPRVAVVDQGSEPANLERLRAECAALKGVTLKCNTENSGVAGGRNQASAMGQAAYIVALDNDAEFADPYVCARAAAAMEAEPDLAALAFRINVFDSPPDAPLIDESSWGHGPLTSAEWADRPFDAKQFIGAGHMIRRRLFDEVGAYDDRLFFMHEEIDLCDRFINAGYRIAYRPDVAVRHKVSAQHRVKWKGGRFRMHLRNKIYLMMKQEGVTFDAFSELLVQTVGGARVGFLGGSLQGFFGALKLIPAAVAERRGNPYLRRTEAGAAYLARWPGAEAIRARDPQPWADANKLWQLICRLRWETDFSRDFKA